MQRLDTTSQPARPFVQGGVVIAARAEDQCGGFGALRREDAQLVADHGSMYRAFVRAAQTCAFSKPCSATPILQPRRFIRMLMRRC